MIRHIGTFLVSVADIFQNGRLGYFPSAPNLKSFDVIVMKQIQQGILSDFQ